MFGERARRRHVPAVPDQGLAVEIDGVLGLVDGFVQGVARRETARQVGHHHPKAWVASPGSMAMTNFTVAARFSDQTGLFAQFAHQPRTQILFGCGTLRCPPRAGWV